VEAHGAHRCDQGPRFKEAAKGFTGGSNPRGQRRIATRSAVRLGRLSIMLLPANEKLRGAAAFCRVPLERLVRHSYRSF